MSISSLALLTSLALASSSADAPSPEVEARIARGQQALADLEYGIAAEELTQAAGDPAADDDQRLRANLYAGIANRIAGRDTEARIHFRYVLLREPTTALPPDTSPKIVSFFESIRHEIEAERAAAQKPAPATAPAVVAPPAPPPVPWALAVAGAGAALLVGGGALAAASELVLEEPSLDAGDKSSWLLAGRAGLVVGGAGALAVAAGAAIGLSE